MAESNEKNYGPHVVGMMLGVCAGSYIEYGVTREEFVDLAGGIYDGVVASLKEHHDLEPGFGDLTDVAIAGRLARLKNLVLNNQLPEERGAALWHLLGQFEDELNKLKDGM